MYALNESDWIYLRNFITNDDHGFMFTRDRRINAIMEKVNTAYGGMHSGSSIGLTMRSVHNIAKFGLDQFRARYLAVHMDHTDDGNTTIEPEDSSSDDDLLFIES